ncbi:hypothetical protein AAL_00421 [Moelleriella libera RCEF 2490]|uniref:Uncharacterized protein n=1 Tax=Moelleriella libera RCEF 2490 TaxID=1081109 RepID=A0A162K478_9HYPO|nr:hypothetical protein AAL_00421 [Moelleriella libera RCEF 2490]
MTQTAGVGRFVPDVELQPFTALPIDRYAIPVLLGADGVFEPVLFGSLAEDPSSLCFLPSSLFLHVCLMKRLFNEHRQCCAYPRQETLHARQLLGT